MATNTTAASEHALVTSVEADGAVEPDGQPHESRPRPVRKLDYLETASTRFSVSTGPIPPPDILAAYGEVQPELVDRIVAMAERQALHRQSMERQGLDTASSLSRLGVQCGLAIGLTGIAAATAMVVQGHAVPGTIIGSVDLVGLVGVFIYGTIDRRRRAERRQAELDADDADDETAEAGAEESAAEAD